MPGTFDATFELFLYENIVLVILVNLNQNINPHKSEFACGQSHFCQSLFKNDAVSPKSFSNKPYQIMKKTVF